MKKILTHASARATLLANDSRGVAAIIFALTVPVLLLVVGFAVNMNAVQNAEAKLSAAVDSATLNAATMYEQLEPDLETASNEFFMANFKDGYLGAKLLPQGAGFISMKHRFKDGKLQVEGYAAADVTLSFASFIGLDTYRIQRRTIAQRVVERNLVAPLAIDETASMCALTPADAAKLGIDVKNAVYPTSNDVLNSMANAKTNSVSNSIGTTSTASSDSSTKGGSAGGTLQDDLDSPLKFIPDPNCTKLEAAKNAAKHFVERIHANVQFGEEPLISVIPFNFKLNNSQKPLPPSIENPETIAPGFYQDLSDALPLAPIVPLTKSKDEVLSGIDAITSSFNAPGWTRTNLATQAAGLILDPTNQQFFGGETPPKLTEKATRMIILLSDGGNQGCCYSEVDGNFNKNYAYLTLNDMEHQKKVCEDLKKPVDQGGAGAYIFTVLLGVNPGQDYQDKESQNIQNDPNKQDGGKWVYDTFKDCASSPQFFFHVPVDKQTPGTIEETLKKVYDQIASFTYKAIIIETDSQSKAPTF